MKNAYAANGLPQLGGALRKEPPKNSGNNNDKTEKAISKYLFIILYKKIIILECLTST